MNELNIKRIIQVILPVSLVIALAAMLAFLQVNRLRADEFLSYLHSNPAQHKNLGEVIRNIHQGADNSYLHAGLLFVLFKTLGANIITLRALSFLFFGVGMYCVYLLIKQHQKSKLQNMLTISLIGLSNIAFMLATDGRYYAMLFCFSACMLYLLQHHPKKYYLIIPIIIGSYLTSAFTLITGLWITAGLLFSNKNLKTHLPWLKVFLGCTFIYFGWLRIDSFQQHFTQWQFSPSTSDGVTWKEFLTYPFRFIAMGGFFKSDLLNCIITIMALVPLVYFNKFKQKNTNLIHALSVLLLAGMALQLLLYIILQWPLWPYRYYAPLFFVWVMSLHQLIQLTPNKLNYSLMLALVVLMGSRSVKEFKKITERLEAQNTEWILKEGDARLVFIETQHKYLTLGTMGNLYIRYPALRSALYLGLDSNSIKRNEYFKLIQQQGNFLQTLYPNEIKTNDVFIVGDSNQYQFVRHKSERVFVIKP